MIPSYRSGVLRFSGITIILGLYFFLQMSTPVYATDDKLKIRPEFRSNWVKINVANMRSGEALKGLSENASLTLVFNITAEEQVNFELNNVNLTEALRRILRQKNFAILYDERGNPSAVYIIGARAMIRALQRDEHAKPSAESTGMQASSKLAVECAECVIEDELDAVAITGAFESPAVLQNSLESPDADERTTALRWAMISSEETGKTALVKALMDNGGLVHSEAMEIIFESGAKPDTVEEILRAVEEKDSVTVQAAVYGLFQ